MGIMRIPVTAVVFLLLVGYASADSGAEYTKESNGFLFKFGMVNPEPKSLDEALMTLSVFNSSTGQLITPDKLRVTISKSDTPLFLPTSFNAKKDSVALFMHTFPEGGNYKISFSAARAGVEGNATFEFFVVRSRTETNSNTIFMMAVVILVSFILVPVFIKLIGGLE